MGLGRAPLHLSLRYLDPYAAAAAADVLLGAAAAAGGGLDDGATLRETPRADEEAVGAGAEDADADDE